MIFPHSLTAPILSTEPSYNPVAYLRILLLLLAAFGGQHCLAVVQRPAIENHEIAGLRNPEKPLQSEIFTCSPSSTGGGVSG